MKTLVKTCLLLLSLSILSETALAGCPGGVCPTSRGYGYSRSYRSYGSSRAYYGVYSGYGVADCGAPSSYGSVNHRERTYVGAFGRTHTRVHHRHHVVTP